MFSVSRILIICFSSMPQSRQHATNGPCLAIWERMEKEPQTELPHENSTCPSVSYPTSSFDGSQSPVFALQRGEEHNGWLSVHPRSGSGQTSSAFNLKRCASRSFCIAIGRVELQVDPHAVVLPHANKDRTGSPTLAVVCQTAKYPLSAAA